MVLQNAGARLLDQALGVSAFVAVLSLRHLFSFSASSVRSTASFYVRTARSSVALQGKVFYT